MYTYIEVRIMNIREMRKSLGITQGEFASRYNIPFRTIQNWESGVRTPPDYVVRLLEYQIRLDLINRKTVELPKYDSRKSNLPKRSDYVGAIAWLKDVRDCVGKDFVFALDEALICQGHFLGRNDEYIIWGYGDDSASKYNGVVLLGNEISRYNIKEKNELKYTDFNRTIEDALANEAILDMQGITEALSHYYYTNGNSFDGIYVSPEYAGRFEELASDAINYYDS